MRRSTKVKILGAIAGLGLTSLASAAPIITTSFIVRDVSGTAGVVISPTSVVGGVSHYTIPQGTPFRIDLNATITQPNVTDAGHTDSDAATLAPISLGAQNLTMDIKASGNNIISARSVTGAAGGQWARDSSGATVAAKLNSAFGFAAPNALNPDSDGDLEPFGAGYANNAAPWLYDGTATGPGSAAALQSGLTGLTGINRGTFFANTPGSSTLTTAVSTANLFAEDPADTGGNANDNILAVDGTQPANGTIINGQIVIDVVPVPEPASLGLLSLGALALVRRRRQA